MLTEVLRNRSAWTTWAESQVEAIGYVVTCCSLQRTLSTAQSTWQDQEHPKDGCCDLLSISSNKPAPWSSLFTARKRPAQIAPVALKGPCSALVESTQPLAVSKDTAMAMMDKSKAALEADCRSPDRQESRCSLCQCLAASKKVCSSCWHGCHHLGQKDTTHCLIHTLALKSKYFDHKAESSCSTPPPRGFLASAELESLHSSRAAWENPVSAGCAAAHSPRRCAGSGRRRLPSMLSWGNEGRPGFCILPHWHSSC